MYRLRLLSFLRVDILHNDQQKKEESHVAIFGPGCTWQGRGMDYGYETGSHADNSVLKTRIFIIRNKTGTNE